LYSLDVGYTGFLMDSRLVVNLDAYISSRHDLRTWHSPQGYPAFLQNLAVNNGSMAGKGIELALKYSITDNIIAMADWTYTNLTPDINFLSHRVDVKGNAIHKHLIGTGFSATHGSFKCDFYLRYSDSGEIRRSPLSRFQGRTDRSFKHFFKTFARFAYTVDLPLLGDSETEFELVLNDIGCNAHQEYGYYIEPEVYAGMKVKF
ncbi:MAG: hypothetical protein GY858_10130, partial [Candidatus Omnitrophica bacterium]|nr:hypothetical protein [Candidatus Omnitrophota bacterium]